MVRELSYTGAVETNPAMAKTKLIRPRNTAKQDIQSRGSEDDWEILRSSFSSLQIWL